ncbi:MAG: hypothetical protein RLZZ234_841 [Candidatus Parcubacteria bacterium]|jgi:hypothetical protein
MGIPAFKITYTKALEQVGNYIARTIVESANHVTTHPQTRRLLQQDASQRVLAEELLQAALRHALKVPSNPPITIDFSAGKGRHTYDSEAQRAVIQWANKGLVNLQCGKIVAHFTHIGVRNDIAHHLAYQVMKTPDTVRTYAYPASRGSPASH